MEQLALDPRAAAAGAFAEEYLQPVLIFEEYRQQLPQDVFDPITAIIKDMGQQLDLESRNFQAKSLTPSLKQQIWAILQDLNLSTLPQLDRIVLHDPPWDPDWEFSLPGAISGFLMKPPKPTQPDPAQKRRRGSGVQRRSFQGYSSNRPFPVSTNEGDTRRLLCITASAYDVPGGAAAGAGAGAAAARAGAAAGAGAAAPQQGDQGKQKVATYRLYTCVDLSQQPPAAERGHTWQEVELRGRTGWVDTSVALGVWEPYTPKRRERDEEKSRRKPQAAAQSLTTARSGGVSSSGGSLPQADLDGTPQDYTGFQAAAAAAGAGGRFMPVSTGVAAPGALQPPWDPAAAAAAGRAGLLGYGPAAAATSGFVPHATTPMLGTQNFHYQAQAANHMQPTMPVLPATAAEAAAAAAGNVPGAAWAAASATPGSMGAHIHPALAATWPPFSTPATTAAAPAGLPPHPPAAGAPPLPPPPAAAAAAGGGGAAAAAGGGSGGGADPPTDLLARLQVGLGTQQAERHARQLITACMSGTYLLTCFMPQSTLPFALQQQQQREAAKQQLVKLLLEADVVDKQQRGLLHLLATHSLYSEQQQAGRHQQLGLLLDLMQSNSQLAAKLTAARNSSSTPLIVAAKGIRNAQDVQVFRLLLQAADACVLATSTLAGGWCVLHRLAHDAAAAAAAAGPLQQQLYGLMLETVQDVLQVAQIVRGASQDVQALQLADMLENMYVSPEHPSCGHFAGHRFMYQLKADLLCQQPQIALMA